MQLIFDKSFAQSLEKLKDRKVKVHLLALIVKIEQADKLNDIPNIKKIIGFKKYYRIRIGDYRLGFELEDVNTLRFIIICHRKDIYKQFP